MNDTTISRDGADLTSGPDLSDHYIEAQTSLVERALRTLKQGNTFAVLDSYGDIGTFGDTPEGLFMRDTRYLSLFDVRIDGKRPLLLGSVIQDDNASLSVDLTNPDMMRDGAVATQRDTIAIERTKLIWDGACYERIAFRNFDDCARTIRISLRFDADFRDLFEVRGSKRTRRGQRRVAVLDGATTEFVYDGLDGITRRTRLGFEPAPKTIGTDSAEFEIALEPGKRCSVLVTVACSEGENRPRPAFLPAYRDTRRSLRAARKAATVIETSNSLFDEVVSRSLSDIAMLVTDTPDGPYPYAGIPWFSTVFGRDGIITAMLLLWVDPILARGVLKHLAATQATEVDPAADGQPGKILHERRFGEMANLGEVPFRHYYGTVDATPLFVMLAGQYFERTGDKDTIAAIWPNIEAALAWCDTYGDRDGDGFVEYFRETESGLANQGWKDSQDSISHHDGTLATGPIALCEVQGYVYAAKRSASAMAATLGHDARAKELLAQSDALKVKFEAAFWCEDIGTYAIALDGAKRPCRIRSSNAGHALFTGIADAEHAHRAADTLMGPEGFSGWGVRTLAQGEARYNPMSYHNGSVWPHDNAIVALGLARYGRKKDAARIFTGMFDAATYQELRRLPELFCGFLRRPRRGPTSYPVACAPQAWAAATPFGLLAASLGLQLQCDTKEVRFLQPELPSFLDEVVLRGIALGDARVDARVRREGHDATVSALSREGDVRIVQSG